VARWITCSLTNYLRSSLSLHSPLYVHDSPSFSIFSQILDEVEKRSSVKFQAIEYFVEAILTQQLPAPGGSITVSVCSWDKPGCVDDFTFTRPNDNDSVFDYVRVARRSISSCASVYQCMYACACVCVCVCVCAVPVHMRAVCVYMFCFSCEGEGECVCGECIYECLC
jgi:hypothetical protein